MRGAALFPAAGATLGLVLLGVTLTGCGRSNVSGPQQGGPTAPVTVQTTPAHRGEIARSITLPSFRTLAYQEATLYAKVSGYLKDLTVDKGDRVQRGQLLATIEVPELIAEQGQYRAESEVAHTNYERLAQARQKAPDLVVPQTVDDLRGQYEVAQAKLQRIETLLNYARITAPFTGVITARFVDPGAFIPAATAGASPQSAALVTLMDFSRVRVQAYVPEIEVPFIRNGVPAQVTAEELRDRVFKGAVTRFAQALDEPTKTMLTEIELPNEDGTIRPGMYLSVKLEVERKPDALLVPADAVITDKSGSHVFVLADGKARKTSVKTAFNDGTNVEIAQGLHEGEPVILRGKQALNDGQAVSPAEAK